MNRHPGLAHEELEYSRHIADARSTALDVETMLSGSQGDLARIVLQIGHMGPAAYPLCPVIAVTAIGRALRALGANADISGCER